MDSGNLNSYLYACMASTLTMEPSSQSLNRWITNTAPVPSGCPCVSPQHTNEAVVTHCGWTSGAFLQKSGGHQTQSPETQMVPNIGCELWSKPRAYKKSRVQQTEEGFLRAWCWRAACCGRTSGPWNTSCAASPEGFRKYHSSSYPTTAASWRRHCIKSLQV